MQKFSEQLGYTVWYTKEKLSSFGLSEEIEIQT